MIRICKKCLMPSTRPRIGYNADGVCNGCLSAAEKETIDWHAREKEFFNLVEQSRPKEGAYDCIVPWSGGKDSSLIAYRLKFDFGLNPLLVTFSPMIPTEIGVHNREQMLRLGFDHVMVRPNQKVARHLAKRFFIERGNPKVCWDAGINSAPVTAAVQYNIPLLFYAEHGESEYGGHVLSEEHKKQRDLVEVLEHQIGDDPMNWMDEVVDEKDLAPYIYPELEDETKIKAMYFAYFFRWDVYENYKILAEKIDFKCAPGGRTSGTFTNYDSLDDKIDNLYYYMQYVKFGFGRGVRDASRLVQLGHLTREEAVKKAHQYDAEFPEVYLEDVIEYLELSRDDLVSVIDKHRNPEIWSCEGGQWIPSFAIN